MDTENVFKADTEDVLDVMKHDVYEILNVIHVGFNHPKGQYRKALLQLKQFDEEEKD